MVIFLLGWILKILGERVFRVEMMGVNLNGMLRVLVNLFKWCWVVCNVVVFVFIVEILRCGELFGCIVKD